MVASAGNGSEIVTRSPACSNEVIMVAASNITDERADFSNFGLQVDIFAPGVDIMTCAHTGTSGSVVKSGTSFVSLLSFLCEVFFKSFLKGCSSRGR